MFSGAFSVFATENSLGSVRFCGISHSHRRLRRVRSRKYRPFSRQDATLLRRDATVLRRDATLLRPYATVLRTFVPLAKVDLRQIAFRFLTEWIRMGDVGIASRTPHLLTGWLVKMGDEPACPGGSRCRNNSINSN